jgi:hypothetical protein
MKMIVGFAMLFVILFSTAAFAACGCQAVQAKEQPEIMPISAGDGAQAQQGAGNASQAGELVQSQVRVENVEQVQLQGENVTLVKVKTKERALTVLANRQMVLPEAAQEGIATAIAAVNKTMPVVVEVPVGGEQVKLWQNLTLQHIYMEHRNVTAFTMQNVSAANNSLYLLKAQNKYQVKQLPQAIMQKIQNQEIVKMEVRLQENATEYEVIGQKQVKILGFIKSKMKVKTQVSAENGEILSEEKPWWAAISSG